MNFQIINNIDEQQQEICQTITRESDVLCSHLVDQNCFYTALFTEIHAVLKVAKNRLEVQQSIHVNITMIYETL